ncbi:MAG: glycerol-3-phosphate 1-O-acyltransferase PlsY [Phycisphaerales bacterium]
MDNAPALLGFALGAYVLGSVPFGLLMGKAKGVDIRAHGSGNIGATNAMRVLGKKLGLVCFLLDVLKGALPVALAGWLLGYAGDETLSSAEAFAWVGVGLGAILGHMFSIFIGFKGGKGVATGFGVLVAVWPFVTLPAVGALVLWYATLKATKYVSVSSCVASVGMPVGVVIAALIRDDLPVAWPFAAVTTALAALVIWKHRANLARVKRGEEPKVGRNKSG